MRALRVRGIWGLRVQGFRGSGFRPGVKLRGWGIRDLGFRVVVVIVVAACGKY